MLPTIRSVSRKRRFGARDERECKRDGKIAVSD